MVPPLYFGNPQNIHPSQHLPASPHLQESILSCLRKTQGSQWEGQCSCKYRIRVGELWTLLTSGSQIVPYSSLLGRALTRGQKLAQLICRTLCYYSWASELALFIYLSVCLSIYGKDLWSFHFLVKLGDRWCDLPWSVCLLTAPRSPEALYLYEVSLKGHRCVLGMCVFEIPHKAAPWQSCVGWRERPGRRASTPQPLYFLSVIELSWS